MRKYVITAVILAMATLLPACGAMTYEEVFRKTHPNSEILHEIKIQKGLVILYSENQNVGAIELLPDGNRWSAASSNNLAGNGAISFGLINKGADDEISNFIWSNQ